MFGWGNYQVPPLRNPCAPTYVSPLHSQHLQCAVERLSKSTCKESYEDAMRSVKHWLEVIEVSDPE